MQFVAQNWPPILQLPGLNQTNVVGICCTESQSEQKSGEFPVYLLSDSQLSPRIETYSGEEVLNLEQALIIHCG